MAKIVGASSDTRKLRPHCITSIGAHAPNGERAARRHRVRQTARGADDADLRSEGPWVTGAPGIWQDVVHSDRTNNAAVRQLHLLRNHVERQSVEKRLLRLFRRSLGTYMQGVPARSQGEVAILHLFDAGKNGMSEARPAQRDRVSDQLGTPRIRRVLVQRAAQNIRRPGSPARASCEPRPTTSSRTRGSRRGGGTNGRRRTRRRRCDGGRRGGSSSGGGRRRTQAQGTPP